MQVLKIHFYKNPKRAKCAARFRDSQQFTKDQLESALALIKLAIRAKNK